MDGDRFDKAPGGDRPNRSVGITAKVAFLLRRAFPEPPEAIETHMSWVFLTADRAYKLKKPVRTQFLDYRRLESRRVDCQAEIELNRPLAPEVYLRTMPLTYDDDRGLALGGPGRVVDWLVIMRRLPATAMLDNRLAADPSSISLVEVDALVRVLVTFYRRAVAEPTAPQTYRGRLLDVPRLDRQELLQPHHALDQPDIEDLTTHLRRLVETLPALDDRSQRVVEGHGDLRPEHVLLLPRPLVIDRITFDRSLRLLDPLFDLALLAVECEHLGAGTIGDQILAAYGAEMSDAASADVVALYRSLRATTRARLSVAHLDDGDREAVKWLDRTDAYLRIARHTLDQIGPANRTGSGTPSGGGSGVEVEEVRQRASGLNPGDSLGQERTDG